jgi:serine protease Do
VLEHQPMCHLRQVLTQATLAIATSLFFAAASAAQELNAPSNQSKAQQDNFIDLNRLQQQVIAIAPKLQPPIVSVFGSSGVLISEDGLILSQWHVSHRRNAYLGDIEERKPDEEIDVITFDGKRMKARLLGADQFLDLSLLQMIEPGPYPHVPIQPSIKPQLGDWVLKLGHPGNYREGRPPVVRLGRVLLIGGVRGVSDCLILGGDSGGPYFDLSGNLVGIIHGSEVGPLQDRGDTRRIWQGAFGFTPVGAIAERIAAMKSGTITKHDQIAYRELLRPDYTNAKTLPTEQWAQGRATLANWDTIAARLKSAVVVIEDDGRQVALGTVIESGGWVVTKASQITQQPTVRNGAGEQFQAKVVGIHPAFDVALLKVEGLQSAPPAWANAPKVPLGTFVVAPSSAGRPIAAGIVSVARRDVPGPYPTELESARKTAPTALPPEVIGSPVAGRGYWIEYVEGNAKEAGLEPGDLLVSIADHPIRRHVDLKTSVAEFTAGEVVSVKVQRGVRGLELNITLPELAVGTKGTDSFSFTSGRRHRFPVVFECDVPLTRDECGGPLAGIDGNVLGIAIERDVYGSRAIPIDVLRGLITDLKNGKPGNTIPVRKRPDPSPMEKETTVSTAELKNRLKQRADAMESLVVEYEVTSDAQVEPELLVGWGMHQIRDYQERHIVGFSGSHQFVQTQRPEFMMHYAPLDQVGPAENAPDDVRRKVEDYRNSMAARKARGTLDHLWALNHPSQLTNRFLFDGQTCKQGTSEATMSPVPASMFNSPVMYLANLMVRPLPPQLPEAIRQAQRMMRQPDAFEFYKAASVLPRTQRVNGADCIVLEAEWERSVSGKSIRMKDRVMFDPAVGYAPRRWEQFTDGYFTNVRVNEDFEQYDDGYWLPRTCTWTRNAPEWVDAAHRARPAYSYRMRLLRAQCGAQAKQFFSR